MPRIFTRISTLITLIALIGLSIVGCSPAITDLPEITITTEPTATEEFVPIIPKNTEEIVIFSFEEDGYAHLFAYIPEQMPLTRLTSGDWDDTTPSPSP